jgi:ribosomal protein S21
MAVNVRVMSRDLGSRASESEKDREFKRMLSIFRKAVMDSGCIQLWKEKQTFESKGEKTRRKRKEAVLARRKENHDR